MEGGAACMRPKRNLRPTRMLWHGERMKAEGGFAQGRNKHSFCAEKINMSSF